MVRKIGSFFLIVMICALPAQTRSGEVLTFATHTTPPLSDFVAEILGIILKEHDAQIKMDLLPGRRVISMVNTGRYDGDACRIINFKEISNDDTTFYTIVNEPIVSTKIVVITHHKDKIEHPTWIDVNQGKVAFIRGSKRIRQGIDEAQQVPVDSANQIYELILRGRVRFGVMFKSIAQYELNKMTEEQRKNYTLHPTPLMEYFLYTYLHKSQSSYIEPIARSLKNLKKSGVYKTIANKHGFDDIAPKLSGND